VTVFPSAFGQATVEPLGQQTDLVPPETGTQLPWQQVLVGVPPSVAGSRQTPLVLLGQQTDAPPISGETRQVSEQQTSLGVPPMEETSKQVDVRVQQVPPRQLFPLGQQFPSQQNSSSVQQSVPLVPLQND
jgi:hypothetical protein